MCFLVPQKPTFNSNLICLSNWAMTKCKFLHDRMWAWAWRHQIWEILIWKWSTGKKKKKPSIKDRHRTIKWFTNSKEYDYSRVHATDSSYHGEFVEQSFTGGYNDLWGQEVPLAWLDPILSAVIGQSQIDQFWHMCFRICADVKTFEILSQKLGWFTNITFRVKFSVPEHWWFSYQVYR